MASKLVLAVVLVFDLIAFGLAIAAEQRRSTAKIVPDTEQNYDYCVYDSDIATGFGVGAFLFLLASQVFIMVASRCFCCGKPLGPGSSRACSIVLFMICWLFFLIAEICLLAGSVTNAKHTKYRGMIGGQDLTCSTLRKGVFGAGAAFIFFTSLVSEYYYVCYSRAMENFQPYARETGVGMGTYK